jgi:hypothetical protein
MSESALERFKQIVKGVEKKLKHLGGEILRKK